MMGESPIVPDHEAFSTDGFVVVPGAVPQEVVSTLRSVVDDFIAAGTPPTRQILYTRSEPPGPRPGMDRLMCQWLNPHHKVPASMQQPIAVIRDLVAPLLEPPPVLFQDVVMEKLAEHAPFPWHQDLPYWPVNRADGVVVWVALDEIDADAGGVHLIRGSHRRGEGPPIDLHTGAAQGSCNPSLPYPGGKIICPTLRSGDALVFHALTWHSSPRKRSPARRRAWATSWLSHGTRWELARAPRHPIARHVGDGSIVTEWLH